ncbi:DUF4349 domain-containing protein, partial [Kineococcus glutinatus]|uniref:DUF4349 domain-containing protein n=1 Tax=Kineococcus glutinatus TaxID=1070872 RepID=UPI0031E62840
GDLNAVTVPGAGRSVISTATLTVEVPDVEDAATAATRLATTAGGLVAAARSGGSGGEEAATLTLRVPGERFTTLLEDLAALGRRAQQDVTSTDVTAEVADVGSRVASAQAVLATLRDRLPDATTIPDVLAVEGEIARRQADLEALQARQRALADQVALSTVDVTLTRQAAAATAAVEPGFTGGLARGWEALGSTVRVVALVAGAVLPFAAVAALLAAPVLLVLRRRRARLA